MAGYNNFVGYGYPNNMNYPQANQMTYSPQMQPNYSQGQQQKAGIEWVDGEVGAKAYQLPQGWPVNVPMPLWDTNDTVIYLKSINAMGMPNPLQKVRYTMEQGTSVNQSMLPANDISTHQDMSAFVTKDEMEKLKDELKAAINSIKEVKWNGKSAV